MTKYSDRQIDIMLNLRLRDHVRPTPWPEIAAAMGVDRTRIKPLIRLEWGVVTGYSGKYFDGDRREYVMTPLREMRSGLRWLPLELKMMRDALEGEGQLRTPPCDIKHIARVLARSEEEVKNKWTSLYEDVLGRDGFGVI